MSGRVARVHLATDVGYPCGVGRRWPSQTVTSTRNPALVTCLRCPQPEEKVVDLLGALEQSLMEVKARRSAVPVHDDTTEEPTNG